MPGQNTTDRSTQVAPPTANRVVLLAIATAAVALVLQLVLIAIGLDRGNPVRLLATPLVGAAVVYFGLRGYPKWGRVRLAAMVGVFLLLFASLA
jgi:hypothetical protein